jgi:hypothetical protein
MGPRTRGEYEKAYAEALKFNFPGLYLDPMMRAVALTQLGREGEAKAAVGQLLELVPDFINSGRWLVARYVKVDESINRIMEDLEKAGLADIN